MHRMELKISSSDEHETVSLKRFTDSFSFFYEKKEAAFLTEDRDPLQGSRKESGMMERLGEGSFAQITTNLKSEF